MTTTFEQKAAERAEGRFISATSASSCVIWDGLGVALSKARPPAWSFSSWLPVSHVERSSAGEGGLRSASIGRDKHRAWARLASLIRPESLRGSRHLGVHSAWIQDGSRIAARLSRSIAENRHRKSNQAAPRRSVMPLTRLRFRLSVAAPRWPWRSTAS